MFNSQNYNGFSGKAIYTKYKGGGSFLDYIDCKLSPKGNWILLTPANELFAAGILRNECDEG